MTMFPGALDTLTELGGPFLNDIPPVDPAKNIDADKRNVLNQATMAVEYRVGVNNSTVQSSLSWATLSDATEVNLGLRFREERFQWPGQVAESGLFLKDATFEPMFHRAGEPVTTFYSLLGGGGGGGSLQDAYNVGASIVTAVAPGDLNISGTENFVFEPSATSFVHIDGTGTSSTRIGGVFELIHNVGADGISAERLLTTNVNNNFQFSGRKTEVVNNGDMLANHFFYANDVQLTMGGNGPGVDGCAGIAYGATLSSFTGTGNYTSIAFAASSTYDLGLLLETGGALITYGAGDGTESFVFHMAQPITASTGLLNIIGSLSNTVAVASKRRMSLDSGGDLLGGTFYESRITTESSVGSGQLVSGGELCNYHLRHFMDASDADDAWHTGLKITYNIPATGGGLANQGSSAYGIYINLSESFDSGSNYHNNDGTFGFNRWAIYIDQGESRLRRTMLEGPSSLGKSLLHLKQTDVTKPFVTYDGQFDGTSPPSWNISGFAGSSGVVGPLGGSPGWAFYRMYKQYDQTSGTEVWFAGYTYTP